MSVSTPADWPRITDVSTLDAEDFKLRNTKFLQNPDQPYETGRGDTPEALREEIWRVRNGDLRTVLREFPIDEPLREQCALWMHAVVGKHDIIYEPWDIDRRRRARVDSHTVRREIDPVELDTLYHRDQLYELWLEFFIDELVVINDTE